MEPRYLTVGLSSVYHFRHCAEERLRCRTDFANCHVSQRMYCEYEGNAVVDVEHRRRNCGDGVCAPGVVVRHCVGRREFHTQLIDDGTQVVGKLISGQRPYCMRRLAQRRRHPVDVVAALSRAGQHGVQTPVQLRIAGGSPADPGLLLVGAIPRCEGDAEPSTTVTTRAA